MMLWSIFWVLVILGLCNSTAIVNSTSVKDGPMVDCKYGSLLLQAAIGNYRTRSLQALRAAANGLNDPAYKAIFKSDEYLPDIFTLWKAMANFPPGEGSHSKPRFRCIQSESEAQRLAPTEPNLWEYCRNPFAMGIGQVGGVFFICPPFFGFEDAYPAPRPQLCPDVDNNEFVESPDKHQFPMDKSIAITRAVLFYYRITENATHYTSIIEGRNDILRRNAAATAYDLDSHLFFNSLVWNDCPDIPDVDLPPWTDPATLNASLVGNLTSNSGSVSNLSKNSTLALDDLQSLNSSDSLLQGSSTNAVGTS